MLKVSYNEIACGPGVEVPVGGGTVAAQWTRNLSALGTCINTFILHELSVSLSDLRDRFESSLCQLAFRPAAVDKRLALQFTRCTQMPEGVLEC